MGVHEFFLDQIVKWLGCKNLLRKVDKQERAPQESTQSVPAPIRSKSESDVHIVTVAPILKGKAFCAARKLANAFVHPARHGRGQI